MKQVLLRFTRIALPAHSWIGLFAAAFIYLISLSGTLSVVDQEMERWEQPKVEEFTAYTPEFIDSAYQTFIIANPEETEHIHIVFPRSAIPRIVVENDHKSFFVNHDGSLGEEELAPWSQMVKTLHTHLHLPSTIGTLVLGVSSVFLTALIISGLFAHKTILREAFTFRRHRGSRVQQTDLHNRLSVWGLPFHLMIAITSAYFGLVGILLAVSASLFHDGDRQAMIDKVFPPEPNLSEQIARVNVKRGLEELQRLAPEAKPIFMTIHDAGSEQQFMEFYTQKSQRLIYSENYRFDASGEYIQAVKPESLPLGVQVLLSTYRLHFGDYAGFTVKLIYVLFGFALTIVSVSGVNIWLEKRRYNNGTNDIWTGVVWGLPLAFSFSFSVALLFPNWVTASFWLSLLAAPIFALVTGSRYRLSAATPLKYATMFNLVFSLLVYNMLNWQALGQVASLGMNGFLASVLLIYVFLCRAKPEAKVLSEPVSA